MVKERNKKIFFLDIENRFDYGDCVGQFRNPTTENPDNLDPVFKDVHGRFINVHSYIINVRGEKREIVDVGGVYEGDVIKD